MITREEAKLIAHYVFLEMQATEQASHEYLTLAEAAEYLHVSKRFMHTHLADIPHTQKAEHGKIIFSRQALDRYMTTT